MHCKRSYWAYLNGFENQPAHEERGRDFWFACFNSRFIVCKIFIDILSRQMFKLLSESHVDD